MAVPFAADSLVPFGPFLRWAGSGGSMESKAPPSISHLIFVFGSLTYKRSFDPFSRDAAVFTFGVPLLRFPTACVVVDGILP